MQHTFGVVIPGSLITSLEDSDAVIRLCGNLPELGSWSVDKAPCMTLRTKDFYRSVRLLREPRFYRVDIQLANNVTEFSYKYLINDQTWEGMENESRQWRRDESKNVVDGVYYTPIDYWIDAKSRGKNIAWFIALTHPLISS